MISFYHDFNKMAIIKYYFLKIFNIPTNAIARISQIYFKLLALYEKHIHLGTIKFLMLKYED